MQEIYENEFDKKFLAELSNSKNLLKRLHLSEDLLNNLFELDLEAYSANHFEQIRINDSIQDNKSLLSNLIESINANLKYHLIERLLCSSYESDDNSLEYELRLEKAKEMMNLDSIKYLKIEIKELNLKDNL